MSDTPDTDLDALLARLDRDSENIGYKAQWRHYHDLRAAYPRLRDEIKRLREENDRLKAVIENIGDRSGKRHKIINQEEWK